jgi:hypothetical protein
MTGAPELHIRRSADHGVTRKGALEGVHHFSFASFQKLDRVEWGVLRAVHHYRLAAGGEREPVHYAGFDVLTLMRSGTLRRTGDFEPRQLLEPGSIELVATGSGALLGLRAGKAQDAAFIEIWLKSSSIYPARRDCLAPKLKNHPRAILASPSGSAGALRLSCAASLERALLRKGDRSRLLFESRSLGYVVVLTGKANINGECVQGGDGIAVSCRELHCEAEDHAELLIIGADSSRKRSDFA